MKSFAKYINEGDAFSVNTEPFGHVENPSNGYFSEAIIQKINAVILNEFVVNVFFSSLIAPLDYSLLTRN